MSKHEGKRKTYPAAILGELRPQTPVHGMNQNSRLKADRAMLYSVNCDHESSLQQLYICVIDKIVTAEMTKHCAGSKLHQNDS